MSDSKVIGKHTPGPWVVDESRHEGSINRLEPFRHIGMVSLFQYDSGSRAENEANARLIAESPRLLEALEEAFDMLGSRLIKDTFGYDWHEKAAAAIARARGLSK